MLWRLRQVHGILLLAVTYLVVARVGLAVHDVHELTSLVWAPIGIAVAAAVLYGSWLWPGIALGALATLLSSKFSIAISLWISAGDVVELLLGVYLLRRVAPFRATLDDLPSVLSLVVVGITVAVLGATLATLGIAFANVAVITDYTQLWSTWWWGHLCAYLVVAPLVLTWGSRHMPNSELPRPNLLEGVALAVSLLIVDILIINRWLPTWLPGWHAPYYTLPLLLWTALRFGPRGAAIGNFAVNLFLILGVTLGLTAYRELADVQSFIAVSSMTSLIVSALGRERQRATQRKEAILDTALHAIVTVDSHGNVLEFNPAAEQLFGYRESRIVGRQLEALLVPADLRRAYGRLFDELLRGELTSVHRVRTRARCSTGSEIPVEMSLARVPLDDQVMITGFVRDISAEIAVERARRELQQELEIRVYERTRDLDRANQTLARREEQLRASLSEKEVLLREIHHRVKNNLQVVSSMLALQASGDLGAEARRRLLESQNRIQSMALVHQLLYESSGLSTLDLAEYLGNLVGRLSVAYDVRGKQIAVSVDAESVPIDIDRAIPCGLVVNELVTNALIHAFPAGRGGEVSITLARTDGMLTLTVRDNGIGVPADFRLDAGPSFGLQIARLLAQQLAGTITVEREHGTIVRMVFPATACDASTSAM